MRPNWLVAITQAMPTAPENVRVWETNIPRYGHVPLVVGPDGKRTAKRHGDARIADFRAKGMKPERIIGTLARWSGLACSGDAMPKDLIGAWSWQKASRERVILTDERLRELSQK